MPREPHILFASSNVAKMIRNITPCATPALLGSLRSEIDRNVQQLFRLGEDHFKFAKLKSVRPWRQKVSRYYYAGFTVCRAVRLHVNGEYSTEVDDHKKFGGLPDDFPDREQYVTKLSNLRIDRNTADYDHTATQTDLLLPLSDIEATVKAFILESRTYLTNRGVTV